MKKGIFLLTVSLVMYGCYSPRYVYSPSTQNIPLLTKKNDVQLSAFYAGGANVFKGKNNYNRGFDFQAAWAVNDHFAAMLNESIRSEGNGGNDSFFPNDSSILSYKRNFTEIAAGYFSSGKKDKKMQLQVFGGAAFGSSKIFDDFTSNSTRLNKYHYSRVTKIFMQPSLIYSPVKDFFTALSSRFTAVIFTHIRTNYTSAELENYILDSVSVAPVFFWEPAVTYTLGFKKFPLKIQVQGSLTVLLNHRFVEHRNSNLALGVIYNVRNNPKSKPSVSDK